MRIKKFNNLWAMGLLLFGIILVACYIMKIFFPDFIVGVAEIPSIVSFGNYVDSHKWAYYLFNSATSFITMYFYGCACCKINKLNLIEILSLVFIIIFSYFVEAFLPNQLLAYNFAVYLVFVFVICYNRKINDINIFYSNAICFVITTFAQSISLEIRDISTLISYPNTATYFVLLIDLYIWNILLYLFFNYKGENNNG